VIFEGPARLLEEYNHERNFIFFEKGGQLGVDGLSGGAAAPTAEKKKQKKNGIRVAMCADKRAAQKDAQSAMLLN